MRYTVINDSGHLVARHLTSVEAMYEILLHDGHDFEIVQASEGDGYGLLVSRFSRHGPCGSRPLVQTCVWSFETDRDSAELEIADRVIHHSSSWQGYPTAMTDADYDAMQRHLSIDMADAA